jgi:hypothetical protein
VRSWSRIALSALTAQCRSVCVRIVMLWVCSAILILRCAADVAWLGGFRGQSRWNLHIRRLEATAPSVVGTLIMDDADMCHVGYWKPGRNPAGLSCVSGELLAHVPQNGRRQQASQRSRQGVCRTLPDRSMQSCRYLRRFEHCESGCQHATELGHECDAQMVAESKD